MTATSVEPIADAFLSLMPGTVYHGAVGEGASVPTPPWSHVALTMPEPSSRSLARVPHLRTVRARVLVYGLTADSVRVVMRNVGAALEGVRPAVTGWRTSPIEQVNNREPVEDRDVTVVATSQHPLYGVLEYLFTASREA